MSKTGSAVVFLLFLLICTALPAVSDTVYILPDITDSRGDASIDELVTSPGGIKGLFEIPPGTGGLDLTEISFLSRSYIEQKLKPYAVRPVVFVGEGTSYLPKRYASSHHGNTFRSLVEAVLGRVREAYDRTEIIFADSIHELEGMLDSAGPEKGIKEPPRIEEDPRGNGKMTFRFAPGRYGSAADVEVRGYYLRAWARRTLETGSTITAADLTVKEVPAQEKVYGAITPNEILAGYVASRRISEGETLTRYNTRKRIDVKAGEGITVIASSGAIEIKLSATARESGRIGEIIDVKPRNGDKLIKARIVSSREAVLAGL